jgi:metal-responsive CopG/Arc/MetJ family transcriptional regulator
MRTIVDIPESDIERLAEVCKRKGISRAEAVRRAVRQFLQLESRATSDEAFGLWRDRKTDGLAYQRKLRKQW